MNDTLVLAITIIIGLICAILPIIVFSKLPPKVRRSIKDKIFKLGNDIVKLISKFRTFITSIQIRFAKKTTYKTIRLAYIINRILYYVGIGSMLVCVLLIKIETSQFFTTFGIKVANTLFSIILLLVSLKYASLYIKYLSNGQSLSLMKRSKDVGFNGSNLRIVHKISNLTIILLILMTLTVDLSHWELINNKTLEKLAAYILLLILIREVIRLFNRIFEFYISHALTYLLVGANIPKAGLGTYPFLTYEKLIDNPYKELCNAYAENFDTSKLTIIRTINGHTSISKIVPKYDKYDKVIFPIENYSFVIKIEGIPNIWQTFVISHNERPIEERDVELKKTSFETFVENIKSLVNNAIYSIKLKFKK